MRASGAGRIDCVIVGYNDVAFGEVVHAAEPTQKWSGTYHNIRTNSVMLGGERITYMDLLNRVRARSIGHSSLQVSQMPSLGAWYLRSFLVKHGYRAEVINSFNHEQEHFLALLAGKPRTVAITTTFYIDAKPIKEVVAFVRAHSPDTTIVVGGPHIYNTCESYAADEKTLRYLLADMQADLYVFDSQGERTLMRVISHLRGEAQAPELGVAEATGRHQSNSLSLVGGVQPVRTDVLEDIPNLVYLRDGELRRTPRVLESNDMDVFSTDWSDVDPARFVPTVTTRTARSCAFSCAFCRYPIMAGPLNLKSIDVIAQQFDLFRERGVEQVVIIDDTFNVPLPRFKQLLRMLIEKQYDFEWFSYFRAGNADEECFDLMAESKCGGVFLGIESGDQSVLDNMNKSVKVERYVRGIRELNQRGITTFASLIIGFPGETAQTVQNTLDFIEAARPTYYRAELYYHGMNTPIHERAREFEIKGAGYGWRHRTMDWKEAARQVERLYRAIRGSVILPLYMFDFWCIPYLLGQGISREQIHAFASTAGEVLVDDLSGKGPDAQLYLGRLSEIFARGADRLPARDTAAAVHR
jgi:radical SAM superfamily enzyme YgiQ (UPF0313 family)